MTKNQLNNLERPELATMLTKEQATLAQLRFDLADRKLKRTSDIPQTRRTIARILTRLAELSRSQAAGPKKQ